jgi:hypothetical protein
MLNPGVDFPIDAFTSFQFYAGEFSLLLSEGLTEGFSMFMSVIINFKEVVKYFKGVVYSNTATKPSFAFNVTVILPVAGNVTCC